MRLDYVSDTLIDFECTIDTNSSDEIINKRKYSKAFAFFHVTISVNAISKVYQLKNSELLDGLVCLKTT